MTWNERSELSCVGWCVHCKCTYSDDARNLLCPIHVIRAFILSFRVAIDSYELLCCLSALLYVHTSFYATTQGCYILYFFMELAPVHYFPVPQLHLDPALVLPFQRLRRRTIHIHSAHRHRHYEPYRLLPADWH